MDERAACLKSGDTLTEDTRVFRIVHVKQRDRKNKSIPAVRCFDLSPADKNKLSVDWEVKTSPEESIARVGATFKPNTVVYKSFDDREIYALEVNFLNSIPEIIEVVYDPVVLAKPQKGMVINAAHASVVFKHEFLEDDENRPQVLVQLRDHAVRNKIPVDMIKVQSMVDELMDAQRML